MIKINLKIKLNNYDYFFFLIKKLIFELFYKKYIVLLNSTFFISLNTIEIEVNTGLLEKIYLSILSIIIILCLLLSVAYAILLERKILASIQRRRGPNYVGFLGLLQPIADAIKLILKETIIPSAADKIIFILSPLIALTLSLVNWAIIPFFENGNFADINVSILMFFAISSLTVYGIIMSGWSSNSKYAFLGALRAAAQVIAYEVCIGLTLVYILVQTQSLNYNDIIIQQAVIYNIIVCFIFFILFFIACLAETNRPPFDLPEAEAELVSGYNVEYSAMTFGYFFLSEYVSIWTVCSLNVIIFLGGHFFMKISSLFFFVWKAIILVAVFIWVRASVPRYRYDQLMRLGWKILLPVTLGCLLFFISIFYYFSSDDINTFPIIENAIKPSINDLMLSADEEKINKEIKDTLEFLIQIMFVDSFIEVEGLYKNTKEALMAEAVIKSMLSLDGLVSFEEISYIYNFRKKIIEAEDLIRDLSVQYPILKEFLSLYENSDKKILLDAEYYKNLKLEKVSENLIEGQSIDCPSITQKQNLEKIWINLSQNIEQFNKKSQQITQQENKKIKLKLRILKSYFFVLNSVLNVVQLKKPIGPVLNSFSWSKDETFYEREERYTVWEMHSKLNKNEKFKADLRENMRDVKIIAQCVYQKKNIINFANNEVDDMMPHAIVVRDMILELEKKAKKKIINICIIFNNNNNNNLKKKKIAWKKNIQLSLITESVLILSNSFLIKLKLDKNINEFLNYILNKIELRMKAQLSNILRKKKVHKVIKYSYKIIQHEKIEEQMRAHIRTLHCVNIWWKLTLKELNKYYIISKDIKILTKIRGFYDENLNINEINILYSYLNEIKKINIKNISVVRNDENNKDDLAWSDWMRQINFSKEKLRKATLVIRKKIANINKCFSSNKQLHAYIHKKMKNMRKRLTLKKWPKKQKILYKEVLKKIKKEKLEKKDLITFKKELKKEGLEKEGWEQEWWDNKNKKDWSWKWMISTIKSISAAITPLDRNNLPTLILDPNEEWDSENDEEYQLIKKALYNENDGWSSEGELTDLDNAKDLVDWKGIILNIKTKEEETKEEETKKEERKEEIKEEETK